MKPICSICRITLTQTETEGEYVCGKCSAVYYPDRQLVEYEGAKLQSAHADEMPELGGTGGNPIMMAGDEQDPDLISLLYKDPKKKPNMGEFAERWD